MRFADEHVSLFLGQPSQNMHGLKPLITHYSVASLKESCGAWWNRKHSALMAVSRDRLSSYASKCITHVGKRLTVLSVLLDLDTRGQARPQVTREGEGALEVVGLLGDEFMQLMRVVAEVVRCNVLLS